MILGKVVIESFNQAVGQIIGNKLRAILSILGITIGVLCIVGVQTFVDSMEDNVKDSVQSLGDDVVYVMKFPWQFDGSVKWWEIMKRPHIDHDDFEAIENDVAAIGAAYYSVELRGKTLKYERDFVENVQGFVATYDFPEVITLNIERGRYFTETEYRQGSNKIILGHNVAEELFGVKDPIGRSIRFSGRKFEVIGVIEKSGDSLIDFLDYDDIFMLGYENARKFINVRQAGRFSGTVAAKLEEGFTLAQMEDEMIGRIRKGRRLKPIEDDNFSLNKITLLTSVLDSIFGTMSLAGAVIGIFSILIGAVSVANIMFVSVKERTSIIGVKKALGARRLFILLEFLIEAIILCLIGGVLGLVFVSVLIPLSEGYTPFDLQLSIGNVLLGVSISIVSGIIAGFIPAFKAALMDPVEAIRK